MEVYGGWVVESRSFLDTSLGGWDEWYRAQELSQGRKNDGFADLPSRALHPLSLVHIVISLSSS